MISDNGRAASLSPPDLGALFQRRQALFQRFEVGQHQFGFDDFQIGNRIDAAFDVGNVGIDETARDIGDGVAIADIGQELVTQAFALRRAAHQAGDVDEVDTSRDDLLGAGNGRQSGQAGLRHGDVAGIRLNGAERIVRRLGGRGLRQGVEQGRLADIGQANDCDFESHESRKSEREETVGRFPNISSQGATLGQAGDPVLEIS